MVFEVLNVRPNPAFSFVLFTACYASPLTSFNPTAAGNATAIKINKTVIGYKQGILI